MPMVDELYRNLGPRFHAWGSQDDRVLMLTFPRRVP